MPLGLETALYWIWTVVCVVCGFKGYAPWPVLLVCALAGTVLGYFDNAKICSAPRQVAGSCDIVRSALLNGRSALSFRQSARIGFQSPANVKVAPPDVHPVRRG